MDSYSAAPEPMAELVTQSAGIRRHLLRLARHYYAQPHSFVHEAESYLRQQIPHVANTLRAGQLLAFFRTARQTLRSTILPERIGGNLPPVITMDHGPTADVVPSLSFPKTLGAANWLRERIAYTPTEFARLDAAAQRVGFTVARVAAESTVGKIRNVLADVQHKSVSVRDFTDLMRDTLDVSALSDPQLETIYRTHTGRASATAKMAILEQPMVRDEFPYLLRSAVHDSRTRPEHLEFETLGLDGTAVFRADDPIFNQYLAPWDWSCRCMAGNARVNGLVKSITRAWYDGEALEIRTASGAQVSVTVNHPMGTPNGMVAAGDLKDSDYLLGDLGRGSEFPDNVDDNPPGIENVFQSLAVRFGVFEAERPNPLEFHGDGRSMQGKIQVVWPARSLMLAAQPHAGEDIHQSNFVGGASGDVGGAGLARPFRFRHSGPLQEFGLASASDGNAGLDQHSHHAASLTGLGNAPAGDAVGGFEGFEGFAGQVAFDQFGRALIDLGKPNRFRFSPDSDPSANNPSPDGVSLFDADFAGQLHKRHSGFIFPDQIVNIRRFHLSAFVYSVDAGIGYYMASDNNSAVVQGNCEDIPLSVEDAAEYGVREAKEWVRTGKPPARPEFVKVPPLHQSASWIPTARALSPWASGTLLSAMHAPAGGIEIAGTRFKGGEFIKAATVAKATPNEKRKLAGADRPARRGSPRARGSTRRYTSKKIRRAAAGAGLKILQHAYQFDHAFGRYVMPALNAILDTPDDIKNKFGYNPSISSGGHADPHNIDPVKAHLGVSAHFAATILTHAIPAAIAYVKRKFRPAANLSALESGHRGKAAELLQTVFREVLHSLGLPPEAAAKAVPSLQTCAAYIAEHLG